MIKRRIISFILVVCMIFAMSTVLFSCKDDKNDADDKQGQTQGGTSGGDNADAEREYSVTLRDMKNNPISTKSTVIVTAYEGETKKSNKAVGEDGKAVFDFTEGNYTFTLTFISPDDKFKYDLTKCVMSEENPSVTLNLAYVSSDFVDLYNDAEASVVHTGTYYTELTAGQTAYFLYTPTQRGRFKVSVSASVDAYCGYYGSAMNIHEEDISDSENRENGAFYIDFRKYHLNSTEYLFGITSEQGGEGYLTIEWICDLEVSAEEQDWLDYKKTFNIVDFAYTGGALVNFDITNGSLNAVYNPEDGYYHLNGINGPVIYINLTKSTPYTDSLEKICESQHFGRFVYDEEGNFLYKISYASMMLEYFAAADETNGIYPLTNDLAIAIKDVGDALGWYEAATPGETHPFFGTQSFVSAIAWLFACCYEA